MKTAEMEVALMSWYDQRQNLVVPNASWGFKGHHEMDLAVLTKAGFLYEVEIKVSMSDLKADAKKRHGHRSPIVKYLYFAFPEKMWPKAEEFVPEHAGILVVGKVENSRGVYYVIHQKREPACTQHRRLTDRERYDLARLGALRVFNLKRAVLKLREENKCLRAFKVEK